MKQNKTSNAGFWGPDSRFGSIPGVVRTRVGYAGGTTQSPTYRNLGDHSEAIEIDFDPAVISFRQLLEIFWKNHLPTARSWSTQYKAAVFYHNIKQKKFALESMEREAEKREATIRTEVLPFKGFYLAEDYHQKYRLKQDDEFLGEFEHIYPSMKDFIGSTAVARVNGYLGGNGTLNDLRSEVDSYGLSERAKNRLISIISRANVKGAACPL